MTLPHVEGKKKEESANAYRNFGMEAKLHQHKT